MIVDFTDTMTPAQFAEFARYETLRNEWVQEHGSLKGFDAWYRQHVERCPA